jgi:hypothetical protein
MEALAYSIPIVRESIDRTQKRSVVRLTQLFKERGRKLTQNEKSFTVEVPIEYGAVVRDRFQHLNNSTRAGHLVPRALFLTMISQYDAFLGALVAVMYLARPELLQSSEKKLNLAEISQHDNIESVRRFIIDK